MYFGFTGVEWSNPDLRLNYSPEGSWDFNDNDPDPMPKGDKGEITKFSMHNNFQNQWQVSDCFGD